MEIQVTTTLQLLYPMPKSSENLREFLKISETLQTRY